MELSEVRRNGRVVQSDAKTEKKGAASALPTAAQAKADKFALSREVLSVLEERNRKIMESGRKKRDGSAYAFLEKGLRELNNCQKIYARVVNGDKVPPEDLRYLEKNDPEGFKMALAMRKPNKHPKECESVLDDEDRAALSSGDGTSAVPAKKPPTL